MSHYNLVIVGGGITGLATALEATKVGYSVAIIDQDQFHTKTSANSHRIIHGGIRYLQHLNLLRSYCSICSQSQIAKDYPDYVTTLPCYLPLKGTGLKRPSVMRGVSLFYNNFAKIFTDHSPKAAVISGDQLKDIVNPIFNNLLKYPLFTWQDLLLISPDKLADFMQKKLIADGSKLITNQKVIKIQKLRSKFSVLLTDGSEELSADKVVLTLGPWFGSVPVEGVSFSRPKINLIKAYNLVLNEKFVDSFGFAITGDKGVQLFFSPREEGTCAVGTWYIPKEVEVTPDIVNKSLKEVSNALSISLPLTDQCVVKVEQGLLPAIANTSSLLGQHQIIKSDGIVEVLSTKYTTFPVIAKAVVELVKSM